MSDKTGVSIMDFKQQFGWQDRELGRGRLLQEIAELRKGEAKLAKKAQVDHRSMHTMTELKDVTRKVVYNENYGEGVLAH